MRHNTGMRVLAFDPGYERLGAAVLERPTAQAGTSAKETVLHSECVRTSGQLPFPERLGLLGKAVDRLISEFQPTAMALEKVYFEKNAKTAMHVAEVRGMLIHHAHVQGLVLFEYTPQEIKVAVTGYGASSKRAVADMVERLVVFPSRLDKELPKRLDDEVDAIAVGITCLASQNKHSPF